MRYVLNNFQVQISKKEIDNVMGFTIKWRVSKKGNSTHQHCQSWKYLLTVGVDEQQEIAISPSILNILVAHFLEHIPYMDVHLSTMLECNMPSSLLSTVKSNE